MANGGVSITINSKAFTDKLARLTRPALDIPVAQSLRDTAKTGIVQATKKIRERTGIKSGVIKEHIEHTPVNAGDYKVWIKSSKAPIPLRDFPGTKATARGVTTKAWGKGTLIASGFAVEKFGGHVFVRKGSARFPIKKLFGPNIGGSFALREVQDVVGKAMADRLQKALVRRMRAAARKLT